MIKNGIIFIDSVTGKEIKIYGYFVIEDNKRG